MPIPYSALGSPVPLCLGLRYGFLRRFPPRRAVFLGRRIFCMRLLRRRLLCFLLNGSLLAPDFCAAPAVAAAAVRLIGLFALMRGFGLFSPSGFCLRRLDAFWPPSGFSVFSVFSAFVSSDFGLTERRRRLPLLFSLPRRVRVPAWVRPSVSPTRRPSHPLPPQAPAHSAAPSEAALPPSAVRPGQRQARWP